MAFWNKKSEPHHEPYDPLNKILSGIHVGVAAENEIRDKKVFIPKWDLTVEPQISELTDKSAVINFRVYNPDWEEPLFECCAGAGKDTDTAIGMAVGSFLFAFLHGISMMMENEEPCPLESEFAGKPHRWRVYQSNVVGMGEKLAQEHDKYWDLLKEHIAKRLGNQKLCYVKVYAAKNVGPRGINITGECRINDVASDELGAIVAEFAEKWNVGQFSSEKQFFFIRQEPETLLPYPYSGKIDVLTEKVKTALEMFLSCPPNEPFDSLIPKMKEALGDSTLAEECYMFLPEICAENAFSQMSFAEDTIISIGGERVNVYKNQLADFYPLKNVMFGLFDSGVFGDKTNDLFRTLVGISSIYGAVCQLTENGSKFEDCKTTAVLFQASADFEIR